jgi:hypothetical protein
MSCDFLCVENHILFLYCAYMDTLNPLAFLINNEMPSC